jgi:hypothetical protein
MDFASLAPILVVSLFLFLAAVGLMIAHLRAWRSFEKVPEPDAKEFNFRWRQFRRRMQTSAMLGLVAIALGAGHPLTIWFHSTEFTLAYWGVVLLLVCWFGLLGLVDMWATRRYYGRLQEDCLLEQTRLRAEASRLQALQGNGRSDKTDPAVAKNIERQNDE